MSQDQQQRKNTFLDVPSQKEKSSHSSSDFQRDRGEPGSAKKKSYENQIHELKEKAHKSFLQVIQMQHLHQEQLEELRKQYEEKQIINTSKIKQLEQIIQRRDKQIKLATRHTLDLSDSSFVLDNIQIINCDMSQRSRLEQSSIQQIQQILGQKNEMQENMKEMQKELSKQIAIFIKKIGKKQDTNKIIQCIDKIIAYSQQIYQQNSILYDVINQLKRKEASSQLEKKNITIQLQSSKKQVKYLSQHIKRIHEDKENIQKKLSRSEHHRKKVEQQLRAIKKTLNQSHIDYYPSDNSILSQSIHSQRDAISFARIQNDNQSSVYTNQSHILNDIKSQKDQSSILKKQEPHFQRQSIHHPQNILSGLRIKKSQGTINENKQPSSQSTNQSCLNSLNFFKKKKIQQNI